MNELEELYQQVIIDHSRQPHNFGVLAAAHCEQEGFNPLCGDRLTLYLELEQQAVKNVSFTGQGCAISIASASLMTDAIKGKTIKEAKHLFEQFHKLLTQTAPPCDSLDKLNILAGVRAFPMRVKCATLAWHTLKSVLENQTEIINEISAL